MLSGCIHMTMFIKKKKQIIKYYRKKFCLILIWVLLLGKEPKRHQMSQENHLIHKILVHQWQLVHIICCYWPIQATIHMYFPKCQNLQSFGQQNERGFWHPSISNSCIIRDDWEDCASKIKRNLYVQIKSHLIRVPWHIFESFSYNLSTVKKCLDYKRTDAA